MYKTHAKVGDSVQIIDGHNLVVANADVKCEGVIIKRSKEYIIKLNPHISLITTLVAVKRTQFRLLDSPDTKEV
jgi:hypothetical protein